MKAHTPLAVALILAGIPIPASAYGVDAGIAAIEARMSESSDCSLDVDPELCPIRWSNGGALDPGDDEVWIVKFVEEAKVTLRPPSGSQKQSISFEPRQLAFEHPIYQLLNETWIKINDTLPSAIKQFVTFDSRPLRAQQAKSWGIFITPRLPFSTDNPLTGEVTEIWDLGVCWEFNACPIWWQKPNTLVDTNETHVQFFPNNVWTRAWDTDHFVKSGIEGLTPCDPWMSAEMCTINSEVRTAFRPIVDYYLQLTPTGGIQVHVNQASAAIEPESAATASALEPARKPPSRADETHAALVPIAGAPRLATSLDQNVVPADGVVLMTRGREAENAGVTPGLGIPSAPDGASLWILTSISVAVLTLALLYHRISRNQVLDLDTRRRIYEAIQAKPGIKVGTLAKTLNLSYKTVQRHVRLMDELGLVRGVNSGQTLYYASGAVPTSDEQALRVLTNPAARAIYQRLQERGREELSSLGAALGLAASTTSMSVSRLERAGLVARAREAGRVIVVPAYRPDLERAVAPAT